MPELGRQVRRRKMRRRLCALLLSAIPSFGQGHTPSAPVQAVRASLAQGVAWIWPQSHGPGVSAPWRLHYPEAAVLVSALVLRGQGVERSGRRLPLTLPAGVRLLPVVHVETDASAPDRLNPAQRSAILSAVRRHVATAAHGAGVLQLDFEAPARQRQAYKELVADIRTLLPKTVRLSVTALAHWCTQGDWLDRLPVDEVVPMLYRLGPNAAHWRERFVDQGAGLARRCQGPAMGFATHEPPPTALLARTPRAYWFDERLWGNPARPPAHEQP